MSPKETSTRKWKLLDRALTHTPFPRRIFHVDVSVKVTNIVRCKFTSLESCKMSGWEKKTTSNVKRESETESQKSKHTKGGETNPFVP